MNKSMQDTLEFMGSESELLLLKGQLLNPTKHAKQGTAEVYYMFTLKCIKANESDDAYLQQYNTYHCVIPTKLSVDFTDDILRDLKNNEVLAICSSRASIRKVEDKRFNNIQLFVQSLQQTRQVVQTPPSSQHKALQIL